jgi:hypothetical protein
MRMGVEQPALKKEYADETSAEKVEGDLSV